MVMRNEQRPDDGLRNCDARQDPIQRIPEVAGLRSDPQWHSRERARQWTLMTSAGGLQQIGRVVCVEEIRPGYIPPLPTAWGLPHPAGHGYDRADFWGWWGCRDLVKQARTPAVPPCCHGNRRQHGDLPALSVAISWSLTTLSRAAVTGAHSFKWKKIQSEFISGINCVKDLGGESLHGLPS